MYLFVLHRNYIYLTKNVQNIVKGLCISFSNFISIFAKKNTIPLIKIGKEFKNFKHAKVQKTMS